MDMANITDRQIKKDQAWRYVQQGDSELWAALPEHRLMFSYTAFKGAVMHLYPGANEDWKYTHNNVERLISDRQNTGIKTLDHMASFYQQLFTMTKYLVDRNRMLVAEQSRVFFHGFRRDLLNKVLQRLQLKFPDHHLDDPYTLDEIYVVAQYALQGASILFELKLEEPAPAPEGQIKNEDLYNLFKLLSSQIAASSSLGRTPELQMSPSITSAPPASVLVAAAAAVPANPIRPANNNKCNFCGEASHFIYKCPVVDIYIQQGLASRNTKGKVAKRQDRLMAPGKSRTASGSPVISQCRYRTKRDPILRHS